MKRITVLLVALLLAGCWQSKRDLYPGLTSATPLRPGKVTSQNSGGEKGHAVLTLARGIYRLTNDARGDSDFGDSFSLRLLPLPGAPPYVWMFDALDNCKPADRDCQPAQHYYGLARVTAQGAEVLSPDCPKTGLPGAAAGDYATCDFTSRALLEKALLGLANTRWKPDVIYRYD